MAQTARKSKSAPAKTRRKRAKPAAKVARAYGRPSPLSEDPRKHKRLTREQCTTELRNLAEANPEQVITRNFFRNNSKMAESAWSAHFGTFAEFKRQSGITLSRHAHAMEKAVAKHAAYDLIATLNKDKREWAGKYLRPNGRRWKIALVCSDIHDKDCDPFYRRVFVDMTKRVQPDTIVLNGDIFDLPEFSKWTVDPREWDVLGRILWVHKFLDDLRAAAPNAELIFVEGNHEFRLLRHLAESTPALRAVLADLHGMTIPGLLGLDKYEVNYVAAADLKSWTERDIKKELKRNYFPVWNSFICHHFPEGRLMGFPGCNGHHHKHIVWPGFSPDFGSFEWHQLGSGHRRSAGYCNGEKWSNGFLVAMVDTAQRLTSFEYVDTTHGHALAGGQIYYRTPGEVV